MGVAAKMVGVATTTTAAGVIAMVEAGEAHQVLVWLRAPPRGPLWSNNRGGWPQHWRRQRRAEERGCGLGRRRGGNFGPTTRAVAAALAEAKEGGGMAREECPAWDGSSPSSRSSSFSRTDDHSEVAVVAGKRCEELRQEEHLGLRLSPSCCVC